MSTTKAISDGRTHESRTNFDDRVPKFRVLVPWTRRDCVRGRKEWDLMRNRLFVTYVVFVTATCIACSDSEAESAGPGADFTLKMQTSAGESPFAHYSYECNACTLSQFFAIEPPEGWQKAPAQIILPTGELEAALTIDDVPPTVDLMEEIPGDEFELIAHSLNGRLVQIGGDGIMAVVNVARNSAFRFPEGRRIHELTDPAGDVFVLFAYEVTSDPPELPDFQSPIALDGYPMPDGWTYTTRIVEETLMMDSNGLAVVLSIRSDISSTWQKR